MRDDDEPQADIEPANAWTLSDDRTSVRLHLPPLPIEGQPEPLIVHLAFDVEAVDKTIGRLIALRARMLPKPEPPKA